MLKKNVKGFTVVELIASFVFTSILAITLFAAVMNYKDKQTDSMISTELLAFKSHVLMDIESDIQKKGLYSIEHKNCSYGDEDNPTTVVNVPRCVELNFNDGDSKTLLVSRKTKVEQVGDATFSVTFAYISYGGVQYRIPDEDNIDLGTDYFFQETEVSDGLETRTPLYRIRIDLIHKDLPQNIVISFVANGSKYLPQVDNPYNEYKIGDLITVRVGGTDKYDATGVHTIENEVLRKFRVIRDSGGFEDSVVAIYDDTTSLGTEKFNANANTGNQYDGSTLQTKMNSIKNATGGWNRVKEIRPITYMEVQYLSSYCITTTGFNVSNAPDWLTSSSYYTMSANTTSNSTSQVWYVDSVNKRVDTSAVTTARNIRPVIVVEKQNITRLER